MRYKVTALRDVLRVYLPGQTSTSVGDQRVVIPSEREEWISLHAGEVSENIEWSSVCHPAACRMKRRFTLPQSTNSRGTEM